MSLVCTCCKVPFYAKPAIIYIEMLDVYIYLISTMAQMAHFSFAYHFTIPNSEFRIPKFALRISEFGIRNCEVYIIWASGNS